MAYRFAGTGTICGMAFPKKLRKVDLVETPADLDITGGGDTEPDSESGLTKRELTVECLGGAPAAGATGSVNVVWGDGDTTAWTKARVTSRKKTGSVGQTNVYTITVVKRPDDAT